MKVRFPGFRRLRVPGSRRLTRDFRNRRLTRDSQIPSPFFRKKITEKFVFWIPGAQKKIDLFMIF